jgi:biotin carboxyl carrier protein
VKLNLAMDGADAEIELLCLWGGAMRCPAPPAPACRFRFGGRERSADVEIPEPGIYSILLDGRSYDASVERTARGLIVTVDGHRFEIEVRDPRRWSPGAARASGEGIETLVSPMPGKVVRVLVAVGDKVGAGQGIVVVEAMKMQNEIKSSRAGRVLALQVQEGATVAAGQALATIG